MNSPNPLFYSCKLLPYQNQTTFLTFIEQKTSENEIAFAIGGRLARILLHALCVFLCIPLFEPKWEPFSRASSVRELYFFSLLVTSGSCQ